MARRRVATVGELVTLDDDGAVGHAVDQASWDDDGSPVLRVSGPPISSGWLEEAGFARVIVC